MIELRKDDAQKAQHPLLTGAHPMGMISGENPHWPAQASGHEEMGKHLAHMGLQAEPVEGRYGQPERSWLVYKPTREQMYQLGKTFGQDSVLYTHGGNHELLYTNGPKAGKFHPGTGHEFFQEAPEDYYTKVPSLGGYMRLAVNFDDLHDSKLAQDHAVDALQSWSVT